MNFDNIFRYADIVALPFFLIMIIYFIKIKDKSTIEHILTFFAFIGFIVDYKSSYDFLNKK